MKKGNRVLLETPDNFWTERLARTVTIQMGCSACVALYAMPGKSCQESIGKRDDLLGTKDRNAHAPDGREQKRDPIESIDDADTGPTLV